MKSIIVVIVIIGLFLFAGCQKAEDFSRYPSLDIPQYTLEDYYQLLFHKNPEIVCNAICILGRDADTIAGMLTDEEEGDKSEEYNLALSIYNRIMYFLSLKDERILSRSLRFLQMFSTDYDKKEELLKPILDVKNRAPNVQYEQLIALSMILENGSQIDPSFIKRSLNNRSWLVSRAAYLVINSLEDNQLRLGMIKKYKVTEDRMEKLLIFLSLQNKFSDQLFSFFADELLTSNDFKIRHQIFDILPGAENINTVIAWLDTNYSRLSEEDISYLVGINRRSLANSFSSALLATFIRKGFVPDGVFLEKLNASIKEYELRGPLSESEKRDRSNLLNIEQALLSRESLKTRWLAMRSKTQELTSRLKKMQEEYDSALDIFVAQTDKILKKYKMDEDNSKEYIRKLSEAKKYFLSAFSQ